jgi:AcrR family transcriptional regulator
MDTDTAPAPRTDERDGRRRRSLDSRSRVVTALLDLVREGEVAPSAERVAARASVGLRTVFRHFNDMDALYREMSRAIESELTHPLMASVAGEDWRARLVAIIPKRAAIYEKIAPFKQAANVHRHRSAFLAGAHLHMVAMARRALEEIVPSSVRDDLALFEMLDLLLSFETWARLRQDQGLGVEDACRAIEFALVRMIDGHIA